MRKSMLAVASTLALTLSACSGGDEATRAADEPALEWSDGWVKATDEEMTGMFGELRNTTDEDITLVKGRSDSAGMVELHEVAQSDGEATMQAVEGGITVPAGKTRTLEPGGLHIMLMKLDGPLEAGDDVTVTVEDAEGQAYELAGQVRTFEGGGENYGGHDHSH